LIREELFAPGDPFTLTGPGTHTAVAVEWSGLESPPSIPLKTSKPAQGQVLRDKPDDFSWTRELWEVAGKRVSRQEAMDARHATMELRHLHDGIIAREQWREGQRVSRVDSPIPWPDVPGFEGAQGPYSSLTNRRGTFSSDGKQRHVTASPTYRRCV
jgi:hypothetical protein